MTETIWIAMILVSFGITMIVSLTAKQIISYIYYLLSLMSEKNLFSKDNIEAHMMHLNVPTNIFGMDFGTKSGKIDANVIISTCDKWDEWMPAKVIFGHNGVPLRTLLLKAVIEYDSHTWKQLPDHMKIRSIFKMLAGQIHDMALVLFDAVLPIVLEETKLLIISNYVSQLTGERITPHIIKLLIARLAKIHVTDLYVSLDNTTKTNDTIDIDAIQIFNAQFDIGSLAVSKILELVV